MSKDLNSPSGESDSEDSSPDDGDSPRGVSQSTIVGGKQRFEVFKKLDGKKGVQLVITFSGKAVAGSNVTLDLAIDNKTGKEIKEIMVKLESLSADKVNKKKKIKDSDYVVTGTLQQYFQGARFPLPGNCDYKGEVVYPIPDEVLTDGENHHFLVVILPIKKNLVSNTQVIARVPVVITK